MPNWEEAPPAAEANYGFRLIRCPAYKPMRAIILSEKMIGTRTHYTKGRTRPCEGEGCEICKEGLPWRWHAYLACLAGEQREKCILELTAQAADQLKPILASNGSLRCIEILADRPSKKPNGRVRIQARLNGIGGASIPAAPDVPILMAHIWGLDDRRLEPDPARKPFDATQIGKIPEEAKPISHSAGL
jgi:hypothetical protein